MIEAEHSLSINANIEQVWDYVQDIRKWANLFPGCQECEVLDEHNSRWIIKVGAGGLVKTVEVQVNIEKWDGPEKVDFTYKLKSEPVKGHGTYVAVPKGANETEVKLQLHVEGSGPMAPMWEAMCKPLLPQLAGAFGNSLRKEIENIVGVPTEAKQPGLLLRVGRWFRNVGRALAGAEDSAVARQRLLEVNKRVALQFIEAMDKADAELADACLAPEAITDTKGFSKLSGIRQRGEIVGNIGAFKILMPGGMKPEIKSVTAEGDRVSIEFEGHATTPDGKAYGNQYSMVFTFTNGKIHRLNEYFCTKLAEEVLWPSVEKMQDQFA
jgi:carbon monoxide dehydrogenase subunit G/ketosteroid isomerase-like protein